MGIPAHGHAQLEQQFSLVGNALWTARVTASAESAHSTHSSRARAESHTPTATASCESPSSTNAAGAAATRGEVTISCVTASGGSNSNNTQEETQKATTTMPNGGPTTTFSAEAHARTTNPTSEAPSTNGVSQAPTTNSGAASLRLCIFPHASLPRARSQSQQCVEVFPRVPRSGGGVRGIESRRYGNRNRRPCYTWP